MSGGREGGARATRGASVSSCPTTSSITMRPSSFRPKARSASSLAQTPRKARPSSVTPKSERAEVGQQQVDRHADRRAEGSGSDGRVARAARGGHPQREAAPQNGGLLRVFGRFDDCLDRMLGTACGDRFRSEPQPEEKPRSDSTPWAGEAGRRGKLTPAAARASTDPRRKKGENSSPNAPKLR